jgi:hypothetical protein
MFIFAYDKRSLLVQELLSSHLMSKQAYIMIYKTIILPSSAWVRNLALTLREVYRLRMFDNRKGCSEGYFDQGGMK